jgi:GntR family phosphonate transport system transcriptional regulator
LAAEGLPDYTRAQTEITAKTANATLAAQLQIQPGAAVLRTVAINIDSGGAPIEYGRTWFAGERVALTLGAEAG